MRVATDTNILLRLVEPGHTQHSVVLNAVVNLRMLGHALCVFPQMLYEFWAVATRPLTANGLGKSSAEVDGLIGNILGDFFMDPDGSAIFAEWRNLVSTYNVLGKQAHDARIAAAMAVHGISHILTFNGADFARYPAVTALDPYAVAAGTRP